MNQAMASQNCPSVPGAAWPRIRPNAPNSRALTAHWIASRSAIGASTGIRASSKVAATRPSVPKNGRT
jgi:hypothetical protein